MSVCTAPLGQTQSTRFSRKNSIFYIRLTVILVMAYMLLIETTEVDDRPWSYLYLALYLGSNLVISRLPNHYFHQRNFFYILVAFDTFMVALGIFIIGQADSYFFVVYFLIIGISAMNRNLKYLMINTFMFIIIYGWIMYISGQFYGDDATRYALRLPFIWAFAVLLGFIIECVMHDVNKDILDLEERYRSLVQSIDSPIFMLNHDGNFVYVNDKTLSNLGTTKKQVLNRPYNEFYSTEEAGLFQNNLKLVFKENKPTQFTSHNQNKDRWFLNVLSPVKDIATGTTHSVSVVSKDITENVKSERALRKAYDNLKQTQDQLIQKNKMEALGRMASGIAHQIRNPLEIILFGVEFLEEIGYRKDELAGKSIDKIKVSTHRVNRIIHDLLEFSRSSDFTFEALDIHKLLNESLEFIEHRIAQSNIVIDADFDNSNLFVQGDKTTLQQVFLNIMNNAVEAMEKNGRLSIRTCIQDDSHFNQSGKEVATQCSGLSGHNQNLIQPAMTANTPKQDKVLLKTTGDAHKPFLAYPQKQGPDKVERLAQSQGGAARSNDGSSWVVVEIEDNGPGMSQELAKNIFEPFYTTKKAKQGTGLGLSIASLIIDRHQGRIEVTTIENQGTRFTIKLLPAEKKG